VFIHRKHVDVRDKGVSSAATRCRSPPCIVGRSSMMPVAAAIACASCINDCDQFLRLKTELVADSRARLR